MTTLTIRIPGKLRKEIRRWAGASDMSMNQWINNTLEKEIKKKESGDASQKI